jgi:hypothetical protein
VCVAIIITGNDRPSKSDLHSMHVQNNDGAGIGWVDNGKAHWSKGHSPDQIDALIDKLPRPLLVHFRFATVGGSIPQLCHPFPVTPDMEEAPEGSADEILIHNGHWSDWDDYYKAYTAEFDNVPGGKWSDTRFAALMMARCKPEDRDSIAAEVGGKIATMVVGPDGLGDVSYWGSWTKEGDGVYYSNTGWKWARSYGGYTHEMSETWYDRYLQWDQKGSQTDRQMAYLGKNYQRAGESHRYVPFHGAKKQKEDKQPAWNASDSDWNDYLNARYGEDGADWRDEPTLTDMAVDDCRDDQADLTATEEFAAVQAQIAEEVASTMLRGSQTHQLRQVTAMVNGQPTTYYTLDAKESE